jgi:hypothetical protein
MIQVGRILSNPKKASNCLPPLLFWNVHTLRTLAVQARAAFVFGPGSNDDTIRLNRSKPRSNEKFIAP